MQIMQNCFSFQLRKDEEKNYREWLGFVKRILDLSNYFRNEKIMCTAKPGKKLSETNRIRKEVNQFINRNGVADKLIDKLVQTIRSGSIEVISVLNSENHTHQFYETTDFNRFFLKLTFSESKK